MRYFSTLAILAISAVAINANAQSGLEKKGDKLVKKFKYEKAIGKYTKAADKDSTNFSAVQKLAKTYVAKGDYASAEVAYQRVLADARATSADKLAYAQVLRSNGKYEEAAKAYAVYAQAEPNSAVAQEFSSFDKEIRLLNRDNKMYELTNLPENSGASDVGAAYSKDGLVLSSNRKASLAKQLAGSNAAEARFDLYTATTGTDSLSPAPGKLHGKVNSKFNDGAATFTRDGKEMIFTQTNKKKGTNKTRTLGLYHADWDSIRGWVNIQPLPFNNVDYNVSQPSISKDGSKLYFVSDMPGGMGGTDIYVADKQGITWAPAVTLGGVANTVGNEVSPFIADDGTLYFASDSRIGLGGLDIYSITPNASGKWGSAINLGMPANSSSDDFGYVSDEKGKHGYIVSNRPGGMGKEDIYKFIKRSEPVCGNIADSKTKIGVEGVEILALSPSGERFTAVTDAKGDFCIGLTPGREYKISTTKE
ncbi:MAG: PD40 domain-containing protein, partial [Bacteroidetes bacterium]|nr:PD40 domain-containing protein [Bacteroidota bacterium]